MDGAPNMPNPNGAPDGVTPEMVVCLSCGAAVRATARFCGACGAEQIVSQAAAPVAQVAPPAMPPVMPPVMPLVTPPAMMAPAVGEGPAGPPPQAEQVAAPMPGTAPSEGQPAPAAEIAPGEGKVCSWCNATNARDASVCAACGAPFPTPEGTEAMERAAKARIDDMQAEIQASRMRGGWWPFRAR